MGGWDAINPFGEVLARILMPEIDEVVIEIPVLVDEVEVSTAAAVDEVEVNAGIPGPSGSVTVGTVTTGAAGTSVSITNSGTASAAVLNFTIPRGNTGDNGNAATIAVGTVTTGSPGSSATVTNAGTSSAAVFNFAIPAGTAGAAATVSVGSVTTGAAGSSASVSNAGTSAAAVLNFTIPRGDEGYPGTAATVSVGSVTTGAAGSSATVTNSGTSSAAVLDFAIPRGATGADGADGSDYSVSQVVFDDFIGGTAYANGWSASGSGSLGIVSGTDAYPGLMGVLLVSTSTGAGGRTSLTKNSGASYVSFGTVAVDLVMRIAFDSFVFDGTLTGQYRIGFIDTVNATDVDGCFFSSINGGNLFAICRSNNVQTATDLGFAPALDGWHTAKIAVNDDGTSCAFYWDGSLVATIPANIPVNRGTGIGLLINKSATSASNPRLAVNWVYEKYTQSLTL